MGVVEGIRSWMRSRNRKRPRPNPTEPLREFVYLDEVSVYSLLASRRSGVATQFTESQTASLNSELGGSLKIGFGGIGTAADSKTQSGQTQASQVIRKAIVQDSFKELHDLENDYLSLTPPNEPEYLSVEIQSDIEKEFEALTNGKWIVDIASINRGDLLEANVELEADPLFRMTMVITTLYELMADRPDIFGAAHERQMEQAYSVGQVLDRLLAGLVPIRGRLVDYEATKMRDREILVHRSVKDKLDTKKAEDFQPVYVTGVAHQGLFWKDIRQILFSESQYRVFCRLATPGLKKDWQPVKIVDLFEGIIPQFKEAIDGASEIARQLMIGPGNVETPGQHQDGHLGVGLVEEYVHLLEDFHQKYISPQLMEDEITAVMPLGNWPATVIERRAVFDQVTKLVDADLGTKTPGDTRLCLRKKVLEENDPDDSSLVTTLTQSVVSRTKAQSERFLDTEIVAIYW